MYLKVSNIKRSYGEVEILKGISTFLEKGKICVVLGPSGSGKSTFLNCIGGLDPVNSGSIIVDGKDVSKMNQKQISNYRRDYIGFVFQFYNLVPNLTVRENIQVCEYLSKNPLSIDELIETLGLKEHQHKFPSQISGGQQQRCAIARALIKNPKLLLCDEPTGALDYKTSKEILHLLEEINQRYKTTMIIITHNTAIENMAHSVIKIKDGNISEEYVNESIIPAKDIEW